MNEKRLPLLLFLFLFLGINSILGQNLSSGVTYVDAYKNAQVTLSGKANLHITAESIPLENSKVSINSPDAFLFFDNVRPSEVVSKYLDQISVNGSPAELDKNVRVCVYLQGTAVIPHAPDYKPMTVYTEANYQGASSQMEPNTYFNELGQLDNKITSFKLKRGYSAILANNADGTGYSRYFVADHEDLEIPVVSAYLRNKISFVRVFRWDWPSKKGWCDVKGTVKGDKLNSTWFYSWGIGYQSTPNQQYVPGKEQKFWPSFEALEKINDVSHLYTYTEPDNLVAPDRMVSPDEAIAAWPTLMKSGLRIGAPAFMYENNIYDFMRKADSLDYRVDYVVVHCYWGGKSPRQWYNDLKTIHERTGRALWIKEWNNGANWTKETWPANFPDQLNKQLQELKGILQVMDTAHFVERYSIYNWVEEKRAMILDTSDDTYDKEIIKQQGVIDTIRDAAKKETLIRNLEKYKKVYADVKAYRAINGEITPAGLYYKDNKPTFAFRPESEVIPQYTMRKPTLNSRMSQRNVMLYWEDPNKEYMARVVIEQMNKLGEYDSIGVITSANKNVYTITLDPKEKGNHTYRIRSVNWDNEWMASLPVTINMASMQDGIAFGNIELFSTDWNSLQFSSSFTEKPVIILGAPSFLNDATIPFSLHSEKATVEGCNLTLDKWKYLTTDINESESLGYLALKPGRANLGGLESEAGYITNVSSQWKEVSFSTAFAKKPAVFVTRSSSSTNFATALKIRNVTTTGFEVMQVSEIGNKLPINNDGVAFLAIEPGEGNTGSPKIEVGFTADNIVGSVNPSTILFKSANTTPVFFAFSQTSNESAAYTTRYKRLVSGSGRIINHDARTPSVTLAKETAAWMVLDAGDLSGIEMTAKGDVAIYPVPATDKLYIKGLSEPSCASIYNISGVKVMECITESEMDISRIVPGHYFIKINQQNFRFIKK